MLTLQMTTEGSRIPSGLTECHDGVCEVIVGRKGSSSDSTGHLDARVILIQLHKYQLETKHSGY
jgi:hypothetical protein